MSEVVHDQPDQGTPGARPSSRTRVWRTVGVVGILAMALFWLWIFSGAARKQNPDFLEDRAWVERAEATCASTQAAVDARSTDAGTQDRAARADAIDASTDDLAQMLDELGAPLPDTAGDREVVEPWLDDWHSLLESRRTFADAIRVNPDAKLLLEPKFNDGVDQVIEVFADVNEMPSCGPAGDVA